MRFVDLLIIYLAAGAPVATYSIFHRSTEMWYVRLTVFLRNLVFWPVIAIATGRSILRNIPNNPHFVTRKTSDSRITEYEENLIGELSDLRRMSPSANFAREFEEAVERYVGLSATVREGAGQTVEGSFFSITDHPNKKIAALCLNRRNLNRIAVHRKRAAQDIFRSFLVADISERSRGRMCDFLVRLAKLYEDNTAAGLFLSVGISNEAGAIDGGISEVEHCLEIEHKVSKGAR